MILIIACALLILRLFYSLAEMYFERDWPRRTWRGLVTAFALVFLCVSAFGQTVTNGRWDWNATTTTGTGQMVPVLALPGAYINFYISCTALPCTIPATTYTASTGSATCPSNAQVVWQPSQGCEATADSQGNFGGYFRTGSYQYTVTVSGHTDGPYNFDVGFGSGGGGGGGSTTNFAHDGTVLTGAFAANPQIYDYDETNIAPDSGYVVASGRFNTANGKWNLEVPSGAPFQMNVSAPTTGQYVVLYPTINPGTSGNYCGNNGWGVYIGAYAGHGLFFGTDCTNTVSGFTLPAGINPANVTSIYAFMISSYQQGYYYYSGTGTPTANITDSECTGTAPNVLGNNSTTAAQITAPTSGLTGTSIPSMTCTVGLSQPSSDNQSWTASTLNVYSIGLIVYYTGTPVVQPTPVYVAYGLTYDQDQNILTTDLSYPELLKPRKVAKLPNPVVWPGSLSLASDGNSTSDCTVGGGTYSVLCISNGIVWSAYAGGGGGSGITQLTGDVAAGPGSGSQASTLATVNSSPGTCGDSTHVCQITTNGKGLTTAQTAVAISGGGGGLTGSGTANFYALWTTSTALGNGHLDDGVTTANAITSSEPINVVCSGCPTALTLTYNTGHAPSPGTSTSAVLAPDTSGNLDVSEGGGPLARVCSATNGVCTGGGSSYTNLPGSGSQTTVAAINTLCSGGTLYATTALSIATGGTVSCPVQFSKAGLWTIASGQTVTFSGKVTETDSPSQHFAGSGTVVMSSSQASVYPDWWGGGGGASASANNAAFAAAIASGLNGYINLYGSTCYQVSSAINIGTTSNVGIQGALSAQTHLVASCIQSTSASASIITVGASSNTKLREFFVGRSVLPSGTAIGISINGATGALIENVNSFDSVQNFYFHGTTNVNVRNSTAGWGYNGLTETANLAYSGFYADSADGARNASLIFTNSFASSNGLSTLTTHCFDLQGTQNSDVITDTLQCYETSQGIYVSGSTTGIDTNSDVHFRNSIIDAIYVTPIYLSNLGQSTWPSINFDDGWVNAGSSAGSYTIDVESSAGWNFNGMHVQILTGGSTVAGMYVHNSSLGMISNMRFENGSTAVTVPSLIVDDSYKITIGGNLFAANYLTSPLITFENSSVNNAFQTNVLSCGGGCSTGISLDSTSSHNHYVNLNAYQTTDFTTPISDAGTDNQLTSSSGLSGMTATQVPIAATATTVTSSKALAGSGAGITTGPTSTTSGDCVKFNDAAGTLADAGSACGSGSGGVTQIVAGTNVTISPSGGTGAVTINASGGGGSSFPFTILQTAFGIFSSSTSWTYTFPNALQSSGATAMLIIGADASGSFTAPSGWTCTINVSSGTNYPRLVVCLKASAGDTTVSFSTANAATPTLRFYEFSGSRSFDVTSGTGYTSGSPTYVNFPAITPTAGSAVFAAATWVTASGSYPSQTTVGSPIWNAISIDTFTAYSRPIGGSVYTQAGAGSSIQPPQISPIGGTYSSSGVAYATFSIK